MRIQIKYLSDYHWSEDDIPVSYIKILSKYKINKSCTFLWISKDNKFEILACCRAYYINRNNIEIGDVWLNTKCRGQFMSSDKNSKKISVYFIESVINKIWKIYKFCNIISLIVDKDNIPALKLYKSVNFVVIKPIDNKYLNIINGLYMEKYKKKIE